jgi:ammonia channel protein AmtB
VTKQTVLQLICLKKIRLVSASFTAVAGVHICNALCASVGAVIYAFSDRQTSWCSCCFCCAALQVPLYALNQHLCFKTLQALDMGGSITIHAFGAYYGLAASLVLSNKRQAFGAYTSANSKNSASYISDLFSIIGTLFLWMFVSTC